MRSHALNGVVASLDLGDHSIQFIAVERAAISNLPARLRIERRVIENDLAFFSRLEFLNPLSILDDGQHFAVFGAGLQVAFENSWGVLTINRTGALLGSSPPRRLGPFPLL